MAFNFLGTFSQEEFEALIAFAEDQLEDVEDRLVHLRSKIEKYGWITFERDEEGNAISYTITPENSVLAKYVRSYQFYGGDILELKIKSRGEWFYFSRGEPEVDSQIGFQGGKIEGQDAEEYYAPNFHYDDGVEANTMAKVKDWMIPAIQQKREEWEFRVKRTIDLVDQYLEEIILLVRRSTGSETIEELQSQIEFYLSSDEFVGAGQKYKNNEES